MDFFLFQPLPIRRCIQAAGLGIEEIIERGPYAPEVEYQSRRVYIFARKPAPLPGTKDDFTLIRLSGYVRPSVVPNRDR